MFDHWCSSNIRGTESIQPFPRNACICLPLCNPQRYVSGGEPHILDTVREVVALHKVRVCSRVRCKDVQSVFQGVYVCFFGYEVQGYRSKRCGARRPSDCSRQYTLFALFRCECSPATCLAARPDQIPIPLHL